MKNRFLPMIACCLLGLSAPGQAAEIKAAVAANFNGTLQQLSKLYQTQSGNTLVISSGASGSLYTQINNGAPFDVFFSADTKRPELLEKEGKTVDGSRFTYALGVPVLWSATVGYVDDEGKVLAQGNFKHLAIAEPRNAPYGEAAQQILTSMNLWEGISSSGKLVKGQSIGQTHSQVASGAAELGFVALAQVKTPEGIPGSSWLPPKESYTPIAQQVVILKTADDPDAAQHFLTWLKGEEARAVITAAGYGLE